MKCTIPTCNEVAEYVIEGYSMCEKHYKSELEYLREKVPLFEKVSKIEDRIIKELEEAGE